MRDTQEEEWRNIDFTKCKYSVSDKGRIRNNETGIILRPINARKGYVKVNLHYGGQRYSRLIHRLVATEFIPNPKNKAEVNHKNGIKDDNRVENLEWVTGEENKRHAYETGLQKHKDDRYNGYLYCLWKRVHREKMCDEWQNFLSFREWCMTQGYEKGLAVVRYDDLSEYSPTNCGISYKIQHSKVAIEKRKLVYSCYGRKMPVDEIAEMFGIGVNTLLYRIRANGMSVEEAVKTPLRHGRPRKEDL